MKKKQGKEVFFCPYCNSQNVSNDFSNPAAIGGAFKGKVCNNCGYRGSFFPKAKTKDIPAVKKKVKKHPLYNRIIYQPSGHKLSKFDKIVLKFMKYLIITLFIISISLTFYLIFFK